MIRRIKTAEDLAWLLAHTHAFQGGQVTDLHVRKHRLFDEASGREITAGTTIIAVIRYELAVRGFDRFYAVTRVAKLTMTGRSEEHTSELQSPYDLVCRLLLEKKK